MITTIHGVLVVVGGRFIEVNYLLRVDSEVLEVGEEGLFECIAVYNVWVHSKEETNNFSVIMAKVISFNEDSVFVEPVKESNVVNCSTIDFSDGSAAVENAAD